MGKPNSQSQRKQLKKGKLQERNFYQCFCARTYQSYSALNLHVKIKHEEIIDYKHLRQVSSEWSGNVKNVYY